MFLVAYALAFTLTASAQFSQFGNFYYPAVFPPQGSALVNPFFLGQNMMPFGPLGTVMDNSLYQFPVGTRLTLQNPNLFYGSFDPNALVSVQLDALPSNQSWLSSFYDIDMYMSARELKESSSGSTGSKHRTLISPIKAVVQRPAPTSQSATEAGTCRGGCVGQRKKSEAMLIAVKNKVLAEGKIPRDAFLKAWNYLYNNWSKFKNKKYMAVVDYRIHSDKKRFFLINLEGDKAKGTLPGTVESYQVTHAEESGLKNKLNPMWGYPTKYDNGQQPRGSNLSTYGFFSTGTSCRPRFKDCLTLSGLDKTNANAAKRGVFIHSFDTLDNGKKVSLSEYNATTRGCFGLDYRDAKSIVDSLEGEALMYVNPCNDKSCPAFR